ncbi:hypothetical protein GGR50DRAFT_678599 [Xylaria sp. CBS 124048]|nr:hypothetical protein GGR50DRAFT_678599 [Xylaria sp. CBS 124048]
MAKLQAAAMPQVPYIFANMPGISTQAPAASDTSDPQSAPQSVKRRRHRRRRSGNKKLVKMQQANHEEVVDHLDQISDILQTAVNEIVNIRLDRRDPRTNTYASGQSISSQPPSAMYSPTEAATIDPDKLARLSGSFSLLEMELGLTRDRLHDLRTLIGPATDDYVSASILELVDRLAERIDSDLARLCIINHQQFDAGLANHVPHMNHYPGRAGAGIPFHGPACTENSNVTVSTTTGDTTTGDARQSEHVGPSEFWEWVYPSWPRPAIPGFARPVGTWRN